MYLSCAYAVFSLFLSVSRWFADLFGCCGAAQAVASRPTDSTAFASPQSAVQQQLCHAVLCRAVQNVFGPQRSSQAEKMQGTPAASGVTFFVTLCLLSLFLSEPPPSVLC